MVSRHQRKGATLGTPQTAQWPPCPLPHPPRFGSTYCWHMRPLTLGTDELHQLKAPAGSLAQGLPSVRSPTRPRVSRNSPQKGTGDRDKPTLTRACRARWAVGEWEDGGRRGGTAALFRVSTGASETPEPAASGVGISAPRGPRRPLPVWTGAGEDSFAITSR